MIPSLRVRRSSAWIASIVLSTGAPSWTLSVGFWTAYAGISQLSPTSPFKRLRSALGGKASGTSGFSSGNGSCHRMGTC